jgi:hypothetical protein
MVLRLNRNRFSFKIPELFQSPVPVPVPVQGHDLVPVPVRGHDPVPVQGHDSVPVPENVSIVRRQL